MEKGVVGIQKKRGNYKKVKHKGKQNPGNFLLAVNLFPTVKGGCKEGEYQGWREGKRTGREKQKLAGSAA